MPARGRPKGSEVKPWQDAIRRAVSKRAEDGGKALDRLAMSLVKKGYEGDVTALKEIGDRLDGKAPQAVIGDNDADPINVVTEIRRVIVRAEHQDR